MPIPVSKIASELAQKLGTETTQEAVEKVVPKAVKAVPKPKRAVTKGIEPEQVLVERAKDIQKDIRRTGYEAAQVRAKEEQIKIDNPPIEGEATVTKVQQEAQDIIYEKKRNLYLKSLTLKKEQELTSIMTENKAKGVSGFDTILDQISVKIGVGRPFSNIEARTGAIYNRVSAPMHDLKESLRTKWVGLSQDTDLAMR